MDIIKWQDIAQYMRELLTTPLLSHFGLDFGPSPVAFALGLFWLAMAGIMWWRVGAATADADVDGTSAKERLLYLALQIVGSGLCVLLAVGNFGAPVSWLLDLMSAILNAKITELGDTTLTVSALLILIAVVVGTFWSSTFISSVTTTALRDRGVDTSGTVGVLLNLGRYLIILVGIAVALTTAGINLTALFTLGAVFAVTIGFALQNISQNFVSGIILLVEGAIKPGDVLEVEGRIVRVVRMGVRSTVARSRDDEDLILPNSLLAQNTVKNLTIGDLSLRVTAVVGVSYDSNVDIVMARLHRVAEAANDPKSPNKPAVLLMDFAESSIVFHVMVWTTDPWNSVIVQSNLRTDIWHALKDEGISIPYRQVDVHVVSFPGPSRPDVRDL